MSEARDGLLLVDKPSGPTSHDVVAAARRAIGIRRIGHTGTLDPLASGLLLLAIGRATRLIRFVPDEPKRYVGSLVLGVRTVTDDVTGETIERHGGTLPDRDAVRAAARALTGRIAQVPPAVSAKKVAGRRAYALRRAGRDVALAPVEVDIERFELAEDPSGDPARWDFEAIVSSGTYIRALARDLGEALGCGGALARLRREAIGPFTADDAVRPRGDGTLDPDVADRIRELDTIPLTPPAVCLRDPSEAARFVSGVAIAPVPATGRPPDDVPYRVVRSEAGRLLGIARKDGDALRPCVVVAPRD